MHVLDLSVRLSVMPTCQQLQFDNEQAKTAANWHSGPRGKLMKRPRSGA